MSKINYEKDVSKKNMKKMESNKNAFEKYKTKVYF